MSKIHTYLLGLSNGSLLCNSKRLRCCAIRGSGGCTTSQCYGSDLREWDEKLGTAGLKAPIRTSNIRLILYISWAHASWVHGKHPPALTSPPSLVSRQCRRALASGLSLLGRLSTVDSIHVVATHAPCLHARRQQRPPPAGLWPAAAGGCCQQVCRGHVEGAHLACSGLERGAGAGGPACYHRCVGMC